jgi:hypothetical protein
MVCVREKQLLAGFRGSVGGQGGLLWQWDGKFKLS